MDTYCADYYNDYNDYKTCLFHPNVPFQIPICQSTGPLSPGNPVFSRALRFTRLPFSLDFSLARKFKGKPRQPLLTTLSRSLALERFASLVAWA